MAPSKITPMRIEPMLQQPRYIHWNRSGSNSFDSDQHQDIPTRWFSINGSSI